MNPEFVARFIDELAPAFEADDAWAAEKTAEAENVARVRAAYQAVSRGDAEGLGALMSDDVELEIAGHPDLPIAGWWKGRDQVLEGAAGNYGQLEDQRPELLSVIAQGDMVAVIGRERGRLRATGREYDLPWMHLYTFRDGRIVRIYGFCDSHSMIEAAR